MDDYKVRRMLKNIEFRHNDASRMSARNLSKRGGTVDYYDGIKEGCRASLYLAQYLGLCTKVDFYQMHEEFDENTRCTYQVANVVF